MRTPAHDIVHTITDWYDGARGGIADLDGVPHYYECRWDDATNDWSDVYLLNRIDEETFRLAMEDWQIWLRWRKAFDEGRTNLETHPALPEDRQRHNELEEVLAKRLVINDESLIQAKGEFLYGQPTLVKWSVLR
ncbi:MAG: hypothetical protein HY231_04955 [Acidobacteria bacterium]|nr:hypothetical protein [Acidobacteriota bacterium]